jgi:hypothetical protein
MTLTLQGQDTMYVGTMSLSGTVKLLQDPNMPTEWSTGEGSDPYGGSIDITVEVSIPARPLDDYPGWPARRRRSARRCIRGERAGVLRRSQRPRGRASALASAFPVPL